MKHLPKSTLTEILNDPYGLKKWQRKADRRQTVAVRQPDGSTKQEINEDMRQSITKKLIEALPQFPLEEMEKGNVR
jgi:hypothetical protein